MEDRTLGEWPWGRGLTWLQRVQLDLLGRGQHDAVVRLPEGHHGRLCQRHLWGPDQCSRLGRLLDHLRQNNSPVSTESGQRPILGCPPAMAWVKQGQTVGPTSALQGRFATWRLPVTQLERPSLPSCQHRCYGCLGLLVKFLFLLIFSESRWHLHWEEVRFLHPALNLILKEGPLLLSPSHGLSPTPLCACCSP